MRAYGSLESMAWGKLVRKPLIMRIVIRIQFCPLDLADHFLPPYVAVSPKMGIVKELAMVGDDPWLREVSDGYETDALRIERAGSFRRKKIGPDITLVTKKIPKWDRRWAGRQDDGKSWRADSPG
jgi:hypothetical protein